MSELLRIQSPHILFHIINRGNARQNVFIDDADFLLYLELLGRYKRKYDINIYHYVLMSNHVHLLIETTKAETISKFMQGLTISYTKRFNHKYHSIGHVWQARFKSIPIETEHYYLRCARYIELNPVRAQIVPHAIDYPWSSYRHSIQQDNHSWLDIHPLMLEYQATQIPNINPYEQFVQEELPNAQQNLMQRFSLQASYGDPTFIKTISDLRYL